MEGEILKKDLKTAFEYYTMAAMQKYPKAMFQLGIFYFYGHGVNKDILQAKEWIAKAAETGYEDALLFQKRNNF
jgi:TPR repeat protein